MPILIRLFYSTQNNASVFEIRGFLHQIHWHLHYEELSAELNVVASEKRIAIQYMLAQAIAVEYG